MECPKCGYERQTNDTHCTLCGLDYNFYENQQAEKKALKDRAKQTTDTKDEEQAPSEPKFESRTVLAEPSGTNCPKCGYRRRVGEKDCPKCGIIYEKHEDIAAIKDAEEKAAKESEVKRLQDEKERRQKEVAEAISREKAKRDNTTVIKARETAVKPKKTNKKALKLVFGVIILVLVGLSAGFFINKQIDVWKEKAAIKKEMARQKEHEKRLAEERKKIETHFQANKDKIIQKLKILIDKKKFNTAKIELKKYDGTAVSGELTKIRKYYSEMKLYQKVKGMPSYKYEENFKLYSKLLKINPKSKLYKKKAKYYGAKFHDKKAEENYTKARNYFKIQKPYSTDLDAALKAIDEAIKLGKRKKIYRNLRHKLIKTKLLFYEGNDKMEMAIRDEGIISKGSLSGQRRLYIWLKNIGSEPFYVNVEYFTLITSNNRKYSYNTCSKGLVKNLKPGEEAKGYIYFYTSNRPKKLVFSHISAGTISRTFP